MVSQLLLLLVLLQYAFLVDVVRQRQKARQMHPPVDRGTDRGGPRPSQSPCLLMLCGIALQSSAAWIAVAAARFRPSSTWCP